MELQGTLWDNHFLFLAKRANIIDGESSLIFGFHWDDTGYQARNYLIVIRHSKGG
jgi:hypothetical protein